MPVINENINIYVKNHKINIQLNRSILMIFFIIEKVSFQMKCDVYLSSK